MVMISFVKNVLIKLHVNTTIMNSKCLSYIAIYYDIDELLILCWTVEEL